MHKSFATPEPVELYVVNGRGAVTIEAAETAETTIDVIPENPDIEDEIRVEQRGNRILVVAPKRRGFGWTRQERIDISVALPAGSSLVARLGSCELVARGRYGAVRVDSGSGDVTVVDADRDVVIRSGSGRVAVGSVGGGLQVKTGSGTVAVEDVSGSVKLLSGSGDLRVGEAGGPVVARTASGVAEIGHSFADVNLSTASGGITIGEASAGRVSCKSASGNVAVGVTAGVPVWTDVHTASGRITSTLRGAGKPEGDQRYVKISAHTASGDVRLEER